MLIEITLEVNGKRVERAVKPETILAKFLREEMALTGTHIGCDTTQCGCCTILLNGDAVKSCTMLAVQADRQSVMTIEGLADGERLHPVQQAFHDHHGLQCGFCTPGFVMSTVELVNKYQNLTEDRIRELVDGNICRCTGYHNIVQAVKAASISMAPSGQAANSESEA
jgi:carbon-monoxide dehydrogenase small subunit